MVIRKGKIILKKEKELKTKKGDKVQVWDEKIFVCLGWGEVVGIGVAAKKEIALIEIEDKLVWADEYLCIPEQKAFEIARGIEGGFKKCLRQKNL